MAQQEYSTGNPYLNSIKSMAGDMICKWSANTSQSIYQGRDDWTIHSYLDLAIQEFLQVLEL